MTAVASRDPLRAATYARDHEIPHAHDSYESLLGDPDVDAVYVALPNALHHRWTMRSLAAGKHVLCEKPYTRRVSEVDEAWTLAEQRGLVLSEAYMWRHANQTRLLQELLPLCGTLRSVHVTFVGPLRNDADVRFDRDLGGGALLDLGCYCVGAARLVARAEPDRVHGEAALGRGGVDEHFAGTLVFGDLLATFQCGFGGGPVNTIDVVGSDGVLHVPQAFVAPPGVILLNGEAQHVEPGEHYRQELEDFAAAIRRERPVLLDRGEMRGQARALDALLRSAGL